MNNNQPLGPLESAPASCSPFVADLIRRWYECAPYGEQVPDELYRLLENFAKRHGHRDEEGMWQVFAEGAPDDPLIQLFECIFETASQFTINRLSNAVYDAETDALKLIGLAPMDEGHRVVFVRANAESSGGEKQL